MQGSTYVYASCLLLAVFGVLAFRRRLLSKGTAAALATHEAVTLVFLAAGWAYGASAWRSMGTLMAFWVLLLADCFRSPELRPPLRIRHTANSALFSGGLVALICAFFAQLHLGG